MHAQTINTPRSIRTLEAFHAHKNNIAGTIPTDIGNLDRLTQTTMEQNKLVGSIPEEFYSNLDSPRSALTGIQL